MKISRVLCIARREFIATVLTKGFLIGVLVVPVIVLTMVVVMPLLINEEAPGVEGEVAVIDPTGAVVPGLGDYLAPEAIAARRSEETAAVADELADRARMAENDAVGEAIDQAVQKSLGEVPLFHVTPLDPRSTDVEQEKQALLTDTPGAVRRLALVILDDHVIRENADGAFGSYRIFVRSKLDDRIVDEIRSGLRRSIIEARIETHGMDPELINRLTRVERVAATAVTASGEKTSNEVLNILVPMGFMGLLLISVMTGSQGLLTSTIEEKSNRVVEVLLSAVSPMELMSGKILGQMGVGLLMLLIYAGMGIFGLSAFAVLGLIDPLLFVFLIIFYFIAYSTLAALMGAIGAAVNELREAQSLMTPVMLIVMIPWLLWMPISRDPNSVFATTLSFIPPINTFVILIRMASTAPPPLWQVLLSVLVGIGGVYVALRMAAKVFRIGLLMYGKPPSFKTLLQWIRMADA
ncbi:MAG: ABC transporter permease [Acidobacteriota bacterium]|nr:ABC transporter permease [Acidobacteriota bacterium]MDQ7086900.1 ABC transporter permease [Acidobacteriota bacterium]